MKKNAATDSLFQKRNPLRDMLIVVAVLAFLAALLEVSVRIVVDDARDFDVEMWKYARQLKRPAKNPRLGHEHIAGASARLMGVDVVINSKKLRDAEYEYAKPRNATRILMIGDSVTFGWGVSLENTVSKYLEKSLNMVSGKDQFEVINAGVGNYNTEMEVEYFLAEGYKYSPDVVILNYFINDAEKTPTKKNFFLSNISYAYVYLAGRFDLLRRQYFGEKNWLEYYRDLYGEGAEGWGRSVDSIERLRRFAQENGIVLLMVNYPELHNLENYPFTGVEKKVRAAARERGIPYLDLIGSIPHKTPEKLWVSPTDAHPNGIANDLYARAIQEKVLEVLRSDDRER